MPSMTMRWMDFPKRSLAVLLVFLNCFVLSAQEVHSSKDDEQRVLALENLWNQAELKKDTKALEQILADDFAYIDIDGTLSNKAEFLKGVQHPTEKISLIGNETMMARTYEKTVVVTGTYTEKGSTNGKPYSRRGRFTDTWIRQGPEWLCVASQSTLIQK